MKRQIFCGEIFKLLNKLARIGPNNTGIRIGKCRVRSKSSITANYTTQKGERMTEMTHGGRREEDGDTRRKRK